MCSEVKYENISIELTACLFTVSSRHTSFCQNLYFAKTCWPLVPFFHHLREDGVIFAPEFYLGWLYNLRQCFPHNKGASNLATLPL